MSISAAQLAEAYGRNVGIIKQQTNGLTHDDSLLQPAQRGNCLNWVVGHIVASRDAVLRMLGQEPVLTKETQKRYGTKSEPVLADGSDIVPLETLLANLDESQTRLATTLESSTPEALRKEVPFFSSQRPLEDAVFFLYFHDTYHTGQTEQLRQLAGTDDAII